MSFDFGKNNSSSSSNSQMNGTQNQTSSGTTTPIAPEFYTPALMEFKPGPNGFYGPQQGAIDWAQGRLNSGDAAGLSAPINYLQDTLNNRGAPTLAALDASGNPAYAAPSDVTAQQIAARKGSEFIGDYLTPLNKDYVDASLSSYDQGSAEARNNLRAGNAGAFGNKRYGVAEGQFAADSALGRGQLASGLNLNAFNTAAGFAGQDANRFLSADSTNAANNLAASTFNANMLNNRQQFDANLGMQYNDQRDRVAGMLANTNVANFNANNALNQDIFNAGGTGYNQALNWLAAGRPLFGQQNNNTSNTTTSATSSGTRRGRDTSMGLGFDVSPFSIFSPGS